MEEDTVVRLARPGSSVADDPLLLVLRDGARRMLQQVTEAEVETFLAAHAEHEDGQGRRRVVRNGHAPEREIQTGIGPISVRRPRVRDRGDGAGGEPIRFTSNVLPPFLRRTRNIEELLPWLYLKGISTGQFEEALTALLGPDAPGLSATTVRRLVATWQAEHERWQRRDLAGRRFVYIWADGVYFTPRLDHDRQCLLVVIGADADGHPTQACLRGVATAHPPNLLHRPLMTLDFAVIRPLVRPVQPHIRFLSIGSRVCSTLPSDPASRRRPCASLTLHRHQAG